MYMSCRPRRARAPRHRLVVGLLCLTCLFVGKTAESQGVGPDAGHATLNGNAIVGAWNFEAGDQMPRLFAQYPEFSHLAASGVVPNLNGWDFRINLPQTRFQLAQTEPGGEPVMVGVVEDPSPIQNADGTLMDYGHRNNAIWMFRVLERSAQAFFKVLPSRRDLQSSATENVRSLVNGWTGIGWRGDPRLKREKIGAAVLGEGLGQATIVLVARREDDELVFSRHGVVNTDDSSWSGQWTSVDASSATPPAVVAAFDGKLALAYADPGSGKLQVKIYDPADDTWSAAVEVDAQPIGAPQLVWDGTALSLLFVRQDGRLRHTYALQADPLGFQDEVTVFTLLVVREGRFDAMAFNQRLHITLLQEAGTTDPTQVWSQPARDIPVEKDAVA